jgi:hypothetical protein
MERMTHRTSAVVISAGGRMQVFRSVAEVPPALRKKLLAATSGPEAATILIADENGRKEILRSLEGGNAALETRVLQGALARRNSARWGWRHWAELTLVAGIGICLWALSSWR